MIEKFCAITEKISKVLFNFSSLLLLFMTLSVTIDVLLRYLLSKPTIWVNEVSGYLLVCIIFFGASYTLRTGGHVKVDLLYEKASLKTRHILTIIAHLFTLGYVTVLSVKGSQMVFLSFSNNWHASTLLGTPLFIPQLAVPLGGFVLALQILALLAGEILELRAGKAS